MKKALFYIVAAVGLLLLGIGLYLLKASDGSQVIPYLCIGFGCGIFGHGAGEIISRYARKNHPEVTKQIEIEQNDERNIAIRNRAEAKAYHIMLPVFGSLMVAFGLMGVDMAVVLLLVAAYLFVCGCSVYYHVKYQKEM